MVRKIIKKYFLKKRIKKNKQSDPIIVDQNGYKTVGVLLHADEYDKKESFLGLISGLDLLNKDIKIIVYNESEMSLPTFDQNTFSSMDFKWNGSLNKPAIEEFLNRQYDIFICYYSKSNHFLDYITTRIQAKLRIGLDIANQQFYDIVFKIEPSQYAIFEKELIKYIQIINNKPVKEENSQVK